MLLLSSICLITTECCCPTVLDVCFEKTVRQLRTAETVSSKGDMGSRSRHASVAWCMLGPQQQQLLPLQLWLLLQLLLLRLLLLVLGTQREVEGCSCNSLYRCCCCLFCIGRNKRTAIVSCATASVAVVASAVFLAAVADDAEIVQVSAATGCKIAACRS